MVSQPRDTKYFLATILCIMIFTALVASLIKLDETTTYSCFFQSSTEVFCYDHDGSLFKLFKRAPDKFTVVIPPKMEKP